MLKVGWSHAEAEYDPPQGEPFQAGLALEDAQWGTPRGRLDVTRSPERMVRIWTTGGMMSPPDAAMRIKAWHSWGWRTQLYNEPNLRELGEPADVEHYPGGPDHHAANLREVLSLLDSEHRLYLTPMSPAPGAKMTDWLDACVDFGVIERVAGLCAHVYGDLGQMWSALDPVLRLGEIHRKPVWIGECGARSDQDSAVWGLSDLPLFLNDLARYAPRVEAVCVFAPHWSRPDPGFQPIILQGTPVEAVMRAWHPPADALRSPTDDTFPENDPGHHPPPDPLPEPIEQPVDSRVEEQVMPTEPTFPGIRGVDVSNHQGGAVDWLSVRISGRVFAVAKASDEGEGPGPFYDPHFARNWEEMRLSGLTRGAYHYARPVKWGPKESLDIFEEALNRAGGLSPGDVIVLDSEDPDSAGMPGLLEWHLAWGEGARRRFGRQPGFYSGAWYMTPNGLNDEPLGARFWLWLASYQDTLPPVPRGWPAIRMWQYAQDGQVPGIGKCLLDLFLGTRDELRLLGNDTLPQEGNDLSQLVRSQDGLWAISEKLYHAKTLTKKAKQTTALAVQEHVKGIKRATGQGG